MRSADTDVLVVKQMMLLDNEGSRGKALPTKRGISACWKSQIRLLIDESDQLKCECKHWCIRGFVDEDIRPQLSTYIQCIQHIM